MPVVQIVGKFEFVSGVAGVVTTYIQNEYAGTEEFSVSSDSFQEQSGVRFAVLNDGRIIATWGGRDGFNNPGVKARFFDGNGRPLDDEFRVNVEIAGVQVEPSVAPLPDGGFIIIWTDERPFPTSFDIVGQRFSASGERIGTEFTINSVTTGFQVDPRVTALANGGFAVSWSAPQDSSADQIRVRAFDASANAVGSETLVSFPVNGDAGAHSLTALTGGNFVVVWSQPLGDVDGAGQASGGVRGQLFDEQGFKLGSAFNLASTIGGTQDLPVVSALADGGFVAAWRDLESQPAAVRAQSFSAGGTKTGPEVLVANTAGGFIDILGMNDGRAIVAWDGTGGPSPLDIKAQMLDLATGARIGEEFLVNVMTAGSQVGASLASLPSGAILIGWQNQGTGGDTGDVRARLFFPFQDGDAGDNNIQGGNDRDFIRGFAGQDRLFGGAEADYLDGGTGDDELRGGAGDDELIGGDGNDLLLLQDGGEDTASGGGGNDGFYMGAALSAGDVLDGGAGSLDQLGLQGNYGGLDGETGEITYFTFSASHLTGIEQIVLLAGSDTRFGDMANADYTYVLKSVDANVGAGKRLVVTANRLSEEETLFFDGSAETDGVFLTYGGQGADRIVGGQGDDGFFFGTNNRFDNIDRVDGQGGNDQLGLQGVYTGESAITFGASQLTSIEFIVLLSGGDERFGSNGAGYSYDITMRDGNVANGATMIVSANTLLSDEILIFDGSAETDGRFRIFSGNGADAITAGDGDDEISGSGGADLLDGGAGADIFLYTAVSDSTGTGFDRIVGFDYRVDKIDLPVAVGTFSDLIKTSLNQASFDADLAAALSGVLGAFEAAAIEVTGGDMIGRLFGVVDANGIAGYQAGEDFVVEFVMPVTPPDPTIDFLI